LGCGAELFKVSEKKVLPRKPGPSKSAQRLLPKEGIICSKCGAQSPLGFRFCGRCGSKLPEIEVIEEKEEVPEVLPREIPRPKPIGELLLISPDGTVSEGIPLKEGETIIGRESGPIFERDSYLSPCNLKFIFERGILKVKDEGSRNGIFYKIPSEQRIEIRSGDIFRIGQELIYFEAISKDFPVREEPILQGSPCDPYWGRIVLIIEPKIYGEAFLLSKEETLLGREEGDILFPEDGYVSGTHLKIIFSNGKYFIMDLKSSNGTFLKIRNEYQLSSDDFLLIGQQLFKVKM
jgi:hypothetical protein